MVIHRSSTGATERAIAHILELTQGDLKLWLSPTQIRILSFTDRNIGYAKKIIKQIGEEIPNLRIDADFTSSTLQGKVKDAEMLRIPYIIVVGDREEKSKEIAVRTRGSKKIENFKVDEFCIRLKKEIAERR